MKEWWEIIPNFSDEEIFCSYQMRRFLSKQTADEYLSRDHFLVPQDFRVVKVKVIEEA